MRFKDLYRLNEGRNRWDLFSIKKGEKKWSMRNMTTNKINYIKINELDPYNSMFRFINSLEAKPSYLPKTEGEIDYNKLARGIIDGKENNIFVKSGKFDEIKNKWILD
jgi:hypothetical protein